MKVVLSLHGREVPVLCKVEPGEPWAEFSRRAAARLGLDAAARLTFKVNLPEPVEVLNVEELDDHKVRRESLGCCV